MVGGGVDVPDSLGVDEERQISGLDDNGNSIADINATIWGVARFQIPLS